MSTEKKQTAKDRYDAKTAYKVGLKLNKKTDAAIIEKLESVGSKQGYIKSLILQDITHNWTLLRTKKSRNREHFGEQTRPRDTHKTRGGFAYIV